MLGLWVVRVGGDDEELRPWHYIYVYSIESRLIKGFRYRYVDFGEVPRGEKTL